MIELPFVLLGGLLGSSHCIGMCGGFALSIGLGAESFRANLQRQLVYSAGRIFTYSFIGAAAGYAGLRLSQTVESLVNAQAGLSILAGVLLMMQGLSAAGFSWRRKKRVSPQGPCLTGALFASFLTAPGLHNVFLAGLLTGFLPCGLVYAYLALATSSASLSGGMTIMAVFGSGTVPLMVAAGAGASLVTLTTRQRLLKIAAWCVVLTGVLSVGRGLGFLHLRGWSGHAACPLCETASDDAGTPASR